MLSKIIVSQPLIANSWLTIFGSASKEQANKDVKSIRLRQNKIYSCFSTLERKIE